MIERTPVSGPFTVSIEGVTEPATFRRLEDAVAALWDSLRVLPLGWTQFDAYQYFFGLGAVERVTAFLEREPRLALSFSMAGRTHLVQITAAR